MRRLIAFALPIGFATLILFSGLVSANVSIAFTPTAFVYLPVIRRDPTPTPTNTPTPTATATPPPGGSGGITGEMSLESNKQTYATHIEDIWFYDLIHNPTGATVYFGILGVNVSGPAPYFKTLWDGAGAGGFLSLNAGCYGPNGIPCAPNPDAGRQRASLRVTAPGTYQLTLSICYSSFTACQEPGGNWQSLASVSITAIDWTPSPDEAQARPSPAELCHLITDDPRGIYLACPRTDK